VTKVRNASSVGSQLSKPLITLYFSKLLGTRSPRSLLFSWASGFGSIPGQPNRLIIGSLRPDRVGSEAKHFEEISSPVGACTFVWNIDLAHFITPYLESRAVPRDAWRDVVLCTSGRLNRPEPAKLNCVEPERVTRVLATGVCEAYRKR